MPQYLVERRLPGFTTEQLMGAAGAAKRTAAEMTSEGKPVRYLRSTFIPVEDKCFCLFEAASPEVVREANVRAHLPMERIVEAAHISADEV
ncbi:MAG: nickel-binding protein [Candidatus Dormibacteraceae bacterium]